MLPIHVGSSAEDAGGPENPPRAGGPSRGSRPALRRAAFAGHAIVVAHFALLVFLVERLQLESAAFRGVLALAFGGYLLQALLPERRRVVFFVALSLVGFGWVLGRTPAASACRRASPAPGRCSLSGSR